MYKRQGLNRLREKYVAKMAESADRRAFEIATSPIGASPAEFREIARAVAGLDTLESFLRDLRGRFPEIGAMSPVAATTSPQSKAAVESAQKVATKPAEPPPAKQAAAAH